MSVCVCVFGFFCMVSKFSCIPIWASLLVIMQNGPVAMPDPSALLCPMWGVFNNGLDLAVCMGINRSSA